MSHVRPDAKSHKQRMNDCKKGLHDYGVAQYIGAGIERRVCATCAAVTIDLTASDESLATPLVQTHTTIESLSKKKP